MTGQEVPELSYWSTDRVRHRGLIGGTIYRGIVVCKRRSIRRSILNQYIKVKIDLNRIVSIKYQYKNQIELSLCYSSLWANSIRYYFDKIDTYRSTQFDSIYRFVSIYIESLHITIGESVSYSSAAIL